MGELIKSYEGLDSYNNYGHYDYWTITTSKLGRVDGGLGGGIIRP